MWSVYRQGRTIAQSDPTEPDTHETLAALEAVRSRQGDVYVISSVDWSEPLPRSTWSAHLDRTRLGLDALAFMTETRTEIATPVRAIASNESAPEAMQSFLRQGSGARTFELRVGKATTKVVQIGDPPVECEIHRGTSLVPVEPNPGEDRALAIANGIASWMVENIDASGRLPYPTLSRDHAGQNARRPCMDHQQQREPAMDNNEAQRKIGALKAIIQDADARAQLGLGKPRCQGELFQGARVR